MKWIKKINGNKLYSSTYKLVGRQNGCKATVAFDENHRCFYFTAENKEKNYHSYWDDPEYKGYKTQEECIQACEKYCEEVLRA